MPTLTQNDLWENGKKEDVINYYKATKDEANVSLSELSSLAPPPHLKDYYDAQIAYLTRLVALSDNILNTLAQDDSKNPDEATQMEKAYQLTLGAKVDNEAVEKTLLSEKLKLLNVKENLNKIAPIALRKNSIQANHRIQMRKSLFTCF